MPLTTTINFNDSEAHSKLLLLLDLRELQIDDPVQTVRDTHTVTTTGTGALQNHAAKITLSETTRYRTKSLELNIETTEKGTLADISDLLQLNPYYDHFYQLLEFSNLHLYARASEGHDLEYLTIEGQLLDDDTLLGFITKGTGIKNVLTNLKLAVHISHRTGSFKKKTRVTITATFAFYGQDINVEISIPLQQNELWSLHLLPPGVSFNINTLLKLGMTQANYDQLPVQVTSIPDFNLNSLSIDFDPSAPSGQQLHHIGLVLGVGKKDTFPWIIMGTPNDPTISLQKIGLSLDMYWDRKGEFSYRGMVNGSGTINSFTIAACIPIPLEGIMTLEARSTDANKQLQSLHELSKGLIDDDLNTHLPDGEKMTKFTLSLNKLRLAIKLDKEIEHTTIQEFELDVRSSKDGSWPIWEDHLTLNEFGLQVLLVKRNDKWQTSGSLYGKGTIKGSTVVALQLQKPTTGPWEIALTEPLAFTLPQITSLSGTDLKENTNNVLPAKLGSTNGDALGVRLRKFKLQFQRPEPMVPYLGFYIETTGKLEIIKDKFTLLGVFCILEIQSPDKDTRKTAVQVGGKIAIGKHAISLLAQKTDDTKGWEYQGKTEPGDLISLNDLLGALLNPVGVTLPAGLPQVTVSNIDLYYAPAVKHVTFKGASQIWITENISVRLSLTLDSKNGADEKDQYLTIKGGSYIDIGDASFLLTAAYTSKNKDGWRFTGRAYDEIVLTDLLRKMLANTVLALPDVLPVAFTLKKAKFELAPTLKYYKLEGNSELTIQISKLTSNDTFPLIVTLAVVLERTAVTSPEAPAEKLKVDLKASALFQLIKDKASLQLTGSYSTENKGWAFTGELKFDQELQFNELIKALGELFKTEFSVPKILNEKKIPLTRAGASINTATNTYTCYSDFAFAINKHDIAITTILTLQQNKDKSCTTEFRGNISLGKKDNPYVFDLYFNKNPDDTWMLATYSGSLDKTKIDLGEFINETLNTSALPPGLTISLNQALIVYHPAAKEDDPSQTLFLISIGNGINLSNLPLVGKLFPADQTLKLNYQIQYASEEFSKQDIGNINDLLKGKTKAPPIGAKKLEQGFDLSVSLQIGDTIIPIDLNLGLKKPDDDKVTNKLTAGGNGDILEPKDKNKDILEGGLTKWFSIQKEIGPLHFSRIGIGYKDDNLLFMLDAAFSKWGLSIAMAGLTVKNPLTRVEPSFSLDGLGIDYKNDVFEIGGSFLRKHIDEEGTDGYNEYDGLAVIKVKESPGDAEDTYDYANETTAWCISAIGSYAYVNDAPSLFIYAALNYPIGGPSFFFVTGLSAGFGYNRKLVMPKLSKVMEFPLLAETLQGKSMPANADRELLLQELQVLHQYIPPAKGQIWLAIGITFTTFKVIDTSLLLAASFGSRFELNLLGVSTLIVPSIPDEDIDDKKKEGKEADKDKKKTTRLAAIKLNLKGAFIPSEGFIGIQGVLAKKSYILSKACKLSGGFAFFAWFNGEHKGDFVATIGGYHPHFKVPEYYPKVPRVGFNWKLGDDMLIKGDVYFALCAHALMAGGHLEATYESGGLKAWFKMGADFLVAWQPYHYEAGAYLDIGCSYTFEFCGTHHITIDVGADVSIWGPEFGGHAVVHLWIFSIGVNFGEQESASPSPIDWKTFSGCFLPKSNLCNITVSNGMVSKGNDDYHLGIVNPKELIITTETFIPTKKVNCSATIAGSEWNTEFGIGSMDIAGNQLLSSQAIKIEKTNDTRFKQEEHFRFTSVTKKVPAGLWGSKLKPEVNDAQFIDNALTGLSIQPKNDTITGTYITIKRDFVQYETPPPITGAIIWEDGKIPTVSDHKNRRAIINQDIVQKNKERTALIEALGLDNVIDLSHNLADDLVTEPVIVDSIQ